MAGTVRGMSAGMAARIDAKEQAGASLKVSGRLAGPWIEELSRSYDRLASAGQLIVVDVADVSFVDSQGIALLRRFLEHGAAVRGCPAYLVAQLYGTVTP